MLAEARRVLAGFAEITTAYVAQMRVTRLVDELPAYVVVFVAPTARSGDEGASLVDRVTEELDLPGMLHVFGFRAMGDAVRRFAEVAGEPFYTAEAQVGAAAPSTAGYCS